MSVNQEVFNTISDLKNYSTPGSSVSAKTLGYYSKGDGGSGSYYWEPYIVKINESSGYISGATSIQVDSLTRAIEKGSIIEFSGGGKFELNSTAKQGDTTLSGTLTIASLIDDEEGGLANDNGLVIKPDFSGFTGTGRWKLVHSGTIFAKQFGIKTDGTEQSSEIQAAIMALPNGSVFKFTPETYTVEGEIEITSKKRLTVDGNGAHLDAPSWASSGTSYLFKFDATVLETMLITAFTRYTITVDSMTAEPSVGDWIQINSSELAGSSSIADTSGKYSADRGYSKSQAVKVESVSGTIITVSKDTPIIFAGGTDGNYLELESYKYYNLGNRTGTITVSNSSTAVTGSGTSFTTEVFVGSSLYNTSGKLIGEVDSITDNTNLVLKENSKVTEASIDFKTDITRSVLYDYNEDIVIQNLYIELNKTTTNLTQGGINLAKCINWKVENCNIRNSTRDCVTAVESIFGRITNCNFTTGDNGFSSGTYGVHLRKTYHCIVAHNTIDAYKALDCDSSFYVTFDNNNCNGALRPHGSLFVTATDNILKGANFPWRAGYSKIQGNTFYCSDPNGQGLFFGEMANTFGNIEVRDNTLISTHEYGGSESEFAIEFPNTFVGNLIVEGNLIKNFARGIDVTGSDSNGNTNLQITNNRIEVYSLGIRGLRYKPSILKDNVIQKLVHTNYASGTGTAISLTSGGGYTPDETIIKGNTILGAWATGFNVSTSDYSGTLYENNFIDDAVIEAFTSNSVGFKTNDEITGKRIYGDNVERSTFKLSGVFSEGNSITITFKGAPQRPLDVIKVSIASAQNDSNKSSRRVYIEKVFKIIANTTDFMINDSTLIGSFQAADGDLTATHSGNNNEYTIAFACPAAYGAVYGGNQHVIALEIMTTRLTNQYPSPFSIITSNPEII